MRRQSGASRLNTECPAVVNARHLHAFRRLYKNDVYFLHNLYQPIACLTRQDLDERKLPAREKKMFDEAKLLEINHLISSKAIEIVLHQDQCDEIRERRPRPMPSRSRRAKKMAPWNLSDMLLLPLQQPCLQLIDSNRFHLYIMDVGRDQRAHCLPPCPQLEALTAVYGLVNGPAVWRK